VVFVEVKTRRTRNFGTGAESVDARKQARIVSAAQHFLATRGNGRERIRFDVVEVDATDGTPRVGHWYEGAFEAGA
jgi:putative endonuclease